METFLKIACYITAVAALVYCFGAFWSARYRLLLGSSSTHIAVTKDGWRLAVHRYGAGVGHPVILCHGLGANAYNMDLGPHNSLARYLAAQGLDVWSIDLRGHGASRYRALGSTARRRFNFDDHVDQDVPAVLDLVSSCTGSERLHWVGHSMGGMVILAYLAKTRDDRVASVCGVGSATQFNRSGIIRKLYWLGDIASWLPPFPVHRLGGILIPFYWGFPLSFPTHEGANTQAKTIRQALSNLVEPIYPGVLAQFILWWRSGNFVSQGREVDYGAGLRAVSTPVLSITGSRDHMVRSFEATAALGEGSSGIRESIEIGKSSGSVNDYGHGDLLIGTNASSEVFPKILGWVESHADEARSADGVTNGRALAQSKAYFNPYQRRLRSRFRKQRDEAGGSQD